METWSSASCVIKQRLLQKINEAAGIIKEKVQEICSLVPAFNKEIDWRPGKSQQGKDYCKYVFKNGSWFDNVAARESSRGKRRHGRKIFMSLGYTGKAA